MELGQFEATIKDQLAELGIRIHDIDSELSHLKPKDLEEQAVDLEDDEVLEGSGIAAQKEIGLLKKALAHIRDETHCICLSCDEPISEERLNAVLHAPLCRKCTTRKQG